MVTSARASELEVGPARRSQNFWTTAFLARSLIANLASGVQDHVNQNAWKTQTALRELDANRDYTDPGERAAIDCAASRLAGRPILDLGVGTGRTVALLSPLTRDYRAVDYMPSMVDICRKRHPGISVAVDDARVLSGAPSGHFGLVVFSYNGIDAVAAGDRARVFQAVHRVLSPGGTFLFSALNLDGPGYRDRPWRVRPARTGSAVRDAAILARAACWTPVHVLRWLRLERFHERGPGYAVAPLSAHHWNVLAHYTTLDRQLEELGREGFEAEASVFANTDGRPLRTGDDVSEIDWFHFVARRR